MLKMHGERHGMHKYSSGPRNLMHRLEHVVLIKNVLGGAVIGDQAVLSLVGFRHEIEVQIHDDRADAAVHVDATIFNAERLIEQAGGVLAGIARVQKSRVLNLLSERLQQRGHEIFLWAPEVLRAELHDLGDAFEGPLQFELSIEFDNRWSKSHGLILKERGDFRVSAPADVAASCRARMTENQSLV